MYRVRSWPCSIAPHGNASRSGAAQRSPSVRRRLHFARARRCSREGQPQVSAKSPERPRTQCRQHLGGTRLVDYSDLHSNTAPEDPRVDLEILPSTMVACQRGPRRFGRCARPTPRRAAPASAVPHRKVSALEARAVSPSCTARERERDDMYVY